MSTTTAAPSTAHSASLFGTISPDAFVIPLDQPEEGTASKCGFYWPVSTSRSLAEESGIQMKKLEALLSMMISANQAVGLDSHTSEELDWALMAMLDIAKRAIAFNETSLRMSRREAGAA